MSVSDVNGEVNSFEGETVLKNFVYTGTLSAGESYEFVASISWSQSANDNEFNVVGGLSIDLGVTLVATQLNDNVNLVATEADLREALSVSGSYILANNINVNANTALVVAQNAKVELDLNGYSILGTSTQSKTTAVIDNKGTLTINDTTNKGSIELVSAIADPSYGYATNAITNNGNLTLNGGTVKNNLSGASYTIDTNVGATTTVNGGNVINKGTAIRAYSWSGNAATTVAINDGYVQGNYAVLIHSLGTGYVADIDVTVNGGTLVSTNANYPFAIYSYHYDSKANTDIALNGGTYYGDVVLGANYYADKENLTVDYANTTFYGDIYRYTDVDPYYEYIYQTTETLQVVRSAESLATAVSNGGDVVLVKDLDIDADTVITVASSVVTNLDLNGHTIAGETNTSNANRDMFTVKGTLNVSNGTVTIKHTGTDTQFSRSLVIFNVTAGGVLNINNAHVENFGGESMNFAIHLNNWGTATVNIENSTIKAQYMAIRVFNSGNDVNNLTIKNSDIHGNKYAVWVHNYTDADSVYCKLYGAGYDVAVVDSLLNFDIYNGTNNLTAGVDGTNEGVVRYGFTNSFARDAQGNLV